MQLATRETEAPAIRRSSPGESLRATAYLAALVWINAYVCRDFFFRSTTYMASMHGFWTALATRAGGSWFHATWWPFWDMGIPFEFTYQPLVPITAAALAALRGVSPAIGFHSATALFYILGPCTLFLMAWRLTRAPGYSFLAALAYSLTSVTELLAPDGDFAFAKLLEARRLYMVAVWDDTPHLAALAFLPLAILFLARAIERRQRAWYAASALAIGMAALASAFGPVMVVLAAACLLFVLRREDWPGNLLLTIAIGAWGWALAAPFLTPSFMRAIREASATSDSEGWTAGSFTALAVVIFGWTVLWRLLPRWTDDWRLQFFTLFAWLSSSIPLIQVLLHRHFLPQPARYKLEMEMALCLAIVFTARPWIERFPPSIRRALLLVALAFAAEQTVDHRKKEKDLTAPHDITATVEYRAAAWAHQNYPDLRYFMPGSMAQWANTYTDLQQFTGESFTLATNQVQQKADTAIGFGIGSVQEDAQLTLTWLKAYGVGAIAISGKESSEYWRSFAHPEKFDGMLPVLWKESGVTIYRVPLREPAFAHIVPASTLVRHAPRAPDDIAEVEKFTAALDDASLAPTQFHWEGRNQIRIHTTAAPDQALSVQVSYHPGWHATLDGQRRDLHKDGLGLMWLLPARTGPCDVVLNYDGGWELRLCRWLSWLALAALAACFVPRKRSPNTGAVQ